MAGRSGGLGLGGLRHLSTACPPPPQPPAGPPLPPSCPAARHHPRQQAPPPAASGSSGPAPGAAAFDAAAFDAERLALDAQVGGRRGRRSSFSAWRVHFKRQAAGGAAATQAMPAPCAGHGGDEGAEREREQRGRGGARGGAARGVEVEDSQAGGAVGRWQGQGQRERRQGRPLCGGQGSLTGRWWRDGAAGMGAPRRESLASYPMPIVAGVGSDGGSGPGRLPAPRWVVDIGAHVHGCCCGRKP